MDGWVEGGMGGWIDGWIHGWIDERRGRGFDGWMPRQFEETRQYEDDNGLVVGD